MGGHSCENLLVYFLRGRPFHVHLEWYLLKYFAHVLKSLASMSLSFVVLQILRYGSFVGINVLNFWWNPVWQVFPCYGLAFGVMSKTSLPDPGSFSSESFCSFYVLRWHQFEVVYFGDRVLLWSPSWTWTPSSPTSASQALGLLVCTVTAGKLILGYDLRYHLSFEHGVLTALAPL